MQLNTAKPKMEILDPTVCKTTEKMSTERLRVTLVKAELDEEVMAEMTREQLMTTWAELVATGREEPKPAAVTKVLKFRNAAVTV